MQIIVDDWATFEPVRTGLTIAVELRRLYPNEWKVDRYNRLLGHAATFEGLKAGKSAEELERGWQTGAGSVQGPAAEVPTLRMKGAAMRRQLWAGALVLVLAGRRLPAPPDDGRDRRAEVGRPGRLEEGKADGQMQKAVFTAAQGRRRQGRHRR